MSNDHAVIWLDAEHALIQNFDWTHADTRTLAREHLSTGAWFDALARSLAGAEEILVTGSGDAPRAFVDWVSAVSPAQRARIFDVQPLAPQRPEQLLAHARRYFENVDRPHHLEPAAAGDVAAV